MVGADPTGVTTRGSYTLGMRRLLPAGAAALGLVGLFGLAACSSGPPPAVLGLGVTTTTQPAGPIAFNVKSFAIESFGSIDPAEHAVVQAGVLSTLEKYLSDAIAAPLRSGQPVGEIGAVFSTRARDKAVTAPDRNALFDEGLPPVSDLRPQTVDLELTGLAGADGKLAVVSALTTITLTGVAEGTPLTVTRNGEFLLVNEEGAWRIDAYSVKASRDTPAPPTTAPAASPPPPVAP